MSHKKLLTWVWVIVFLALGVASGLIVSSRFNIMNISRAQKEKPFKASPALVQMSDALADVAAQVMPAVVNISTTKTVKEENPMYPFFEDPLFRKFFGEPNEPNQREKEFKERSLGSGVIVSSDGYIITNNHVIEGASEIKVVLADKREFKAKVVGADSRSDVAVIKIAAKDLPTITWGNSDKLRPGGIVMAVGSPFGLTQSVTMGIISAVGRANVGIEDYEDFIQTDAAINPGNSGGALVDMKGELVGINTAIYSRTGGYQGIGFAVPSNMARQVMESLIKTGKVIRGYLGVSVQDVTPELAKQFGVPVGEGALVGEVVKGSPAEKAGFKQGDVIEEFNGQKVEDSGHLRNLTASTAVGSKVNVVVIRNKKKETITVTVGELPKKMAAAAGQTEEAGKATALSGVSVENLTPDLISKLGLSAGATGVAVISVKPGSAAEESGLQRGDVITEIDRNTVRNIKDYNNQVRKLKKNAAVLLLINRQGATLWLPVSPGE
ncbi:MAG: DegQ family serine endoprotease [Nitrospirota bacterium]